MSNKANFALPVFAHATKPFWPTQNDFASSHVNISLEMKSSNGIARVVVAVVGVGVVEMKSPPITSPSPDP